jgi:hypothetical protein
LWAKLVRCVDHDAVVEGSRLHEDVVELRPGNGEDDHLAARHRIPGRGGSCSRGARREGAKLFRVPGAAEDNGVPAIASCTPTLAPIRPEPMIATFI